MSQSKGRNTSLSSAKAKVRTLPLLSLFGVATLGYYLIMAAIYALFGERLTAWLSNPLFWIAALFITNWEGSNRQQDINWWDYIKIPQISFRKILFVILTIFGVQFLAGFISQSYLSSMQPDANWDGFLEGMSAQFETWGSATIFVAGGVLSYFLGGYVAGKLSPYPYLAPYSHAAVGEFIFYFISNVTILYLFVCECGEPPTHEDVGWFVVWTPPYMLLSLFGAWFGTQAKPLHSLGSLGSRLTTICVATGKRMLGSGESTDPSSESSKCDGNSEPLVADNLSNQPTAGRSKNEDLKSRTFIRNRRKHGKKKRR